MSKGYTIVEPTWLGALYSTPRYFDFVVMILRWISVELQKKLENRYPGLEIDVIACNYHGVFPVLGVHDPNHRDIDVIEIVNESAKIIIRTQTVEQLIAATVDSPVNWADYYSESSEEK